MDDLLLMTVTIIFQPSNHDILQCNTSNILSNLKKKQYELMYVVHI